MGIVTVPDARVDYLAEKYHSKKVIPAAIEFVDIAGLVKELNGKSLEQSLQISVKSMRSFTLFVVLMMEISFTLMVL